MDFYSLVGRSRRKTLDGLFSVHKLVEECLPLWVNLAVAVEGRSRYSRKCRVAMGCGVVWGGFDTLEQIVNRARLEVIKLENMETDIKTKVDRAFMNQKMDEEPFYLMHTNVFYITAEEGGVVPAEISLARMS